VQYTDYPGSGEGLSGLPWVRGEPPDAGLVGLLWYWPEDWKRRHLREARIFTGGVVPAGYNVKILWAFLSPSAKDRGGSELVVEGDRLDAAGAFRQEFGRSDTQDNAVRPHTPRSSMSRGPVAGD
jgi:hypothetical protein